MKENGLLLLILAAIAAFGGFLLSLGIDFSPRQQTESVHAAGCFNAHPEWDTRVCQGVEAGRYTTQDVLGNPSWDWELIGSGRLQLGMTADMVEAAWGAPAYSNAGGSGGDDEEWAARDRLLRFQSGILREIAAAQVWSVAQILAAVDQSEAGFGLRTRGRIVLIVGEISDTGTEMDGSPRIEFQSASYYGAIQCFFPPARSGEAGVLRKGQSVVIAGTGDGMGLVGPTFRDCRVFSTP